MKKARTKDGQLIEATPDAPAVAECPECGGELKLRSRRVWKKENCVYFWRHRSNKNSGCSRRRHPFS